MTQEDQNILHFIDEHQEFLLANQIDIAHSALSNRWFIYRYEEKYGYYDYYIEFQTLPQLINIILDEMHILLCLAIDEMCVVPTVEHESIADQIAQYKEPENLSSKLCEVLLAIMATETGKSSTFFQMLDKLYMTSQLQ